MIITVIVFDLIVVYLLLMCSAKLYGGKCCHFRIFIASLAAAVHSGAIVSGGLPYIDRYAVRIIVLIASASFVFGYHKKGILKTLVFLIMYIALGGTLSSNYLVYDLQRLVGTVIIALMCLYFRCVGTGLRSYAHVKIRYRGRSVSVDALRDTGNDLKDILSGAPVLVIGPDAASRLTGLDLEELASPLETMERRPMDGLRLIPFSSVGNSHGLMLGIRPDDATVDGTEKELVIAMASEGMGMYEALIGGYHDTFDDQTFVKKILACRGFGPLHRRNGCSSFTFEGHGGKGGAGSS